MKKIISLFLALITIFSMCAIGANAYETTSGCWAPYGKYGTQIYWTFNEETKTLTLSGEGRMIDKFPSTEYYQYPWFGFQSDTKTIIIEDGIEYIGEEALGGFANATTITLGKGLKEIGKGAFNRCCAINEINFPEGLEIIGEKAFMSCINLREITLPSSVSTIKLRAFEYCKRLENIYLNANIKNIAENIFKDLDSNKINIYYPLCENKLKQICPEFVANAKATSHVLICAPCKSVSEYVYVGEDKHVRVSRCEMCKEELSRGTPSLCYRNNGVCIFCDHEAEPRNIIIKIGANTYKCKTNVLPPYNTIENVPIGLKVVGYWYKTEHDDIFEIDEGKWLDTETDVYYAICAIDKGPNIARGIINYIFYSFVNILQKIF